MPSILKVITVVVVTITAIAGIVLSGLRDVSRRPDYCNSCHVMEPYVRSWMDSNYLAYKHALSSKACQRCHPQTLQTLVGEAISAVRGTYSEPLPEIKQPKEMCLQCHGSYQQLAEETKSLNPNPHATHLGEEECYQCHKMHEESPGMTYCVSCHHTGDLVACTQCHEEGFTGSTTTGG